MTRKRIKYSIWALLLAIVVAAAVVAHFMGISAYVITGGSMTGSIPKGSLAIDRNVPVAELKAGDVITFQPPHSDGNVTHRIVQVLKDKDGRPVFRTKGDYNQAVDPWLFNLDKQVQAENIFHVAYVGYALAAFTLRWVRTGILVLASILILSIALVWLRKNPDEERMAEKVNFYKTCGTA
jgi:signal peptidase